MSALTLEGKEFKSKQYRSRAQEYTKTIVKEVAPAFEHIIFDWDYETYLVLGGYGSGKSYNAGALKIVLKLLEEKRTALVIRQVFDTIAESCYSLICEILSDMDILTEDRNIFMLGRNRVYAKKSPMQILFPNGSRIIFKGLDKAEKIKSINNVSIIWLEEASEVHYDSYIELIGRLRTPNVTSHFILTCNPISRENWIYKHFFSKLDNEGNEVVIMPEEKFYDKHTIVKGNVYYHHSTPDDNPFLPSRYIKRLDELRFYDYAKYLVARWGQFGVTGIRALPQLRIAPANGQMKRYVQNIPTEHHYFGFDFGFEESYNAVISCAIDIKKQTLYIYDEIYMNNITDDKFLQLPEMQILKHKLDSINEQGYSKMLVADSSDPKAIQYYRQNGFKIRACRNRFAGSRLSNIRKIKRFKRIVILSHCRNTIRELRDLTYKKKPNGEIVHDEFTIDPHTLWSTIYALDTVTVADIKDKEFYSKNPLVKNKLYKEW